MNFSKYYVVAQFIGQIKFFKDNKGQSLIETVLLFPAVIMLFCLIVDMSSFMITRQQLVSAARYGTDLIVHCNFNAEQVQEELTNYLTDENIEGRRLTAEGLDFKVEINTFPTIYTFSTKGGNPLTLIKDLASPIPDNLLKYNASVEIRYKEKIFPLIAKILGEDFFSIVARSEVFDGTGPKNNHS